MGKIVQGLIMPHPPLLVPEVGRKNLVQVAKTRAACEKVCNKLKAHKVDTIIIFTPHGAVGQSLIPIYIGHVFEGNFAAFGAPKPNLSFKGEAALALEFIKKCDYSTRCYETLLDHGCLVPLYYVHQAGIPAHILPIAISLMGLKKLYEFGKILQNVILASSKNVAIIASADMSHRLTPDAPAGFDPKAKEFDQKLVEMVANNNVSGIINFDPRLAEQAGQDALWSIAMLLGAMDGIGAKPEVLSYEGPFGVGYMVAEYGT